MLQSPPHWPLGQSVLLHNNPSSSPSGAPGYPTSPNKMAQATCIVVLEELLPNHQAVLSDRDVPVVLDGPVDVQVPVDAPHWRIKLYGADRACDRIHTSVFLLKTGVKDFLRLLPEWGQELLCLHLITLNGEVIEPGNSSFSQWPLQSSCCLNPSPKLVVLEFQGAPVYPKRLSNQLHWVLQL
jgi:hypothetical protein